MRLIDADALYKKLNDIRKEETLLHGRLNNKNCCTLSTALFEIDCAHTIEPERKRGRWLIREGISDAQCSECKMYFRDVYDMDNSDAFCRHCGAKMEGLKVVEDE